MGQLLFDCGRQDHISKQGRKYIDVPNKNQVIDGTCVGDDEPHSSESQALQCCYIVPKVFNGVIIDENIVGFQEAIQLISGAEAEKLLQVGFREMAGLELLKCKGFQSTAREILSRRG